MPRKEGDWQSASETPSRSPDALAARSRGGTIPACLWLALAAASVLFFKAYAIVMSKGLAILGFGSLDFVVMAGICWGLALALAARSWVKLNEGNLMALRREQLQAQARRQAQELEFMHDHNTSSAASGAEPSR